MAFVILTADKDYRDREANEYFRDRLRTQLLDAKMRVREGKGYFGDSFERVFSVTLDDNYGAGLAYLIRRAHEYDQDSILLVESGKVHLINLKEGGKREPYMMVVYL